MWEVPIGKAAAAFLWGLIVGYFASIAIPIWAFAVWTVFGERRSVRELSWRKAPPPWVAFKRILVFMPLIALVHPLPWALALIGWFVYQLIIGAVEPVWWWAAISFFACFVWFGAMWWRTGRA